MIKFTLYVVFFLAFPYEGNSQEQIISVSPASELFLKYPNVRDFTIASSGEEAYFTIQSPIEEISVIASIKREDDIWLEPEILNFSVQYKYLEPFLSPDNKKLYFVSNRPMNDSIRETKDYDIWFVTRENSKTEWSRPINLGKPVNSKFDEFYPSVAASGNLYFTRNSPDSKGEDDIFFSECTDGLYEQPTSLGEAINSEGYEFNSYIAADQSYLIYTGYGRKDGFGSGDLYISYKNKAGEWVKASNLGPGINSKQMDYCPFVDEKSKTLYFTSKRSGVTNNGITRVKELLEEINKYENGLSRIYKTSFSEIESAIASIAIPLNQNKIVIDGVKSKNEWKGLTKINLSNNYDLYLTSDANNFYIATFKTTTATTYTDIYLSTDTGYLNLHASMQLGERVLPIESGWDDQSPEWEWGNNNQWMANRVVYNAAKNDDTPFHDQIKSYQGQEFKIAKEKLGSEFSMLVVIRDFVDPMFRISYPSNGNEHEPLTWQRIEMEQPN